jgi:hypothetical protein
VNGRRKVSIGAVLRRAFGAYAERAALLIAAALVLTAGIGLDSSLRHVAAVGAALVNILLLALFASVVVLAADETWKGQTRFSAGELLSRAWSAVGRLLLVGVIASVAIVFVGSIAPAILLLVVLSAAFADGFHLVALVAGLLLISIVLLVLQLYLLTAWSVFVSVTVLERPRGLRALGRSRELVRGNGWRVLALVLVLVLPVSLSATALEGALHALGAVPARAGELILATLIAPLPILTMTSLYYELCEGTLALTTRR